MRAVVQRVRSASVSVEGSVTGAIETGLAVLLGVAVDDEERDVQLVAEKLAGLRIFEDDAGLMNLSVSDVRGSVLLISQFTLLGDARKGRRPSFIRAAREELARPLYELTGQLLERAGLRVAYGMFGADMQVALVNDGPVTIMLDSKRLF